MDIVNLEMTDTEMTPEMEMALAALEEARLDRAYAALAAKISVDRLTGFCAGQVPQIGGDFLKPFVFLFSNG